MKRVSVEKEKKKNAEAPVAQRKVRRRSVERNVAIRKRKEAKKKNAKEMVEANRMNKAISASKELTAKQVSEVIGLIDKRLSYKALQGQARTVPVNTAALAIFFGRLLDRFAMTTPLFVSRGGATNYIYPVDFLMFCWISTFLHVRDVGVVTGDMVELPSFSENMSIPVALASILQYLGRFEKSDLNLVSSMEIPVNYFATLINQGHYDPALTYPFVTANDGQVVDYLTIGGSQDLEATRGWVAMSVGAWCKTRLFKVVGALKSLNIATVPLREIPHYAPGPEAYCCRGTDPDTGVLFANRVFSHFKPFDSELGTIFSIGRINPIFQAFISAPITSFMTNPGYGYGTYSLESYLAAGCVHLLMAQVAYKHGPIKRVYSFYRGTKISTFAWATKYIDGAAVQGLFGITWKQVQRQLPGFNDVQGGGATFRQFYCLYALFMLHLHHRVELASPVANLALRITGTTAHSISAYYNEGLADSIALPAALDKFIQSIGLVVSNGAMICPRFRSAPNTAVFTWGDAAWENNLVAMSWKGLKVSSGNQNIYPMFWEGSGAVNPFIKTPYYTLDAAYNAIYVGVNTAGTPYPIQHPQMTIASIASAWQTTTSSQVFKEFPITMVSKKSNLDSFYGSPGQMCSVSGGALYINRIDIFTTNGDLSALDPDVEKLGTPSPVGPISARFIVPSIVASSMILNSSEALEAVVIPSRLAILDQDTIQSPYTCKMTVTSVHTILEELIDLTTQAGVNNSAVDSGQQKLLISSTGHVIPTKSEDHPTGPSKWDLAVAQVGQKTVPPLVGAAASVACDFIPLIGEFLSPICAAGASNIVAALMSRGSTTGQSFARPVNESEAKSKIQAVRDGVFEMAKLVGAKGAAVAKTSDVLTKVAASQVRGIVTPKMLEQAKEFHK